MTKLSFEEIKKEIINTDKYQSLKDEAHHGMTRYKHSLNVAKLSYRMAKILKADYISTTRGALLHDYFNTSEYRGTKGLKTASVHPILALNNANRDFKLNDKEQNIKFDECENVIKKDVEMIYSNETMKNIALVASVKGLLQQYKNTPLYDSVTKLIYFLEPKVAKEVLINFYTPLYYKGEISGVITGAIGETSSLKPKLLSSFFGHQAQSFICDENYIVISSACENINPGLDIKKWNEYDILSKIVTHSQQNDIEPFRYEIDGRYGLCCTSTIKSNNWHVVVIVYPSVLSTVEKEISGNLFYISIAIIIVLKK